MTVIAAIAATISATVFVSPCGDDAATGSESMPVATATCARDRVRAMRAAGEKGTVEIVFADGLYRMSAPLVLDSRDSGVKWRAANRGKAVLSGAIVPGWHRKDDSLIVATVPGDWSIPGFAHGGNKDLDPDCPIAVYAGKHRLPCARWPNGREWAKSGLSFGGRPTTNKWGRGTFTAGDYHFNSPRMTSWAKEKDIWVCGYWQFMWAGLRSRLMDINPAAGTFHVDNAHGYRYKFGADAPFFVFNAECERDQIGEWTVDRDRREVTLLAGASAKSANRIEIAVSPMLVKACNVSNVTFEGLVLEKTRSTALSFRDCSHVTLAASVVRNTGRWGVWFTGARDCAVRGCDLYDLGEGGVMMEGGERRTLTPSGNVVDNCHIHDYGKEYALYRPGVQLNGVGVRATHNLIHHADHQAMAFEGNDHVIAYNVIHDVCRDTDDAGAIYTFAVHDWSERGTVVEHNVIHMTGSQPRAKHVFGIYFDNHCSGNICRYNIINRSPTGIWASGGHHTRVESNIVINCDIAWARGNYGKPNKFPYLKPGRKGDLFRSLTSNTNCPMPVLLAHYPEIRQILDMEDVPLAQSALFTRLVGNCYVGSGHPAYHAWAVTGEYTTLADNEEIKGDPGFVDYYGMDWRLKADSPIRKVQGDGCDFVHAGLYDDPMRFSPAMKFSSDVSPPRPFGIEPQKADVRVGVLFQGKMPKGDETFGYDFLRCQPEGAGRILVSAGMPPYGKWEEYTFAFTPDRDCTVMLQLEGRCGEKTIYDDVRVEGAVIKDGSFESGKDWTLREYPVAYYPKDKLDAFRAPFTNPDPPYGIQGKVQALEGTIVPADGSKMCLANRAWRVEQIFDIKKDVRVTISFKARSYVPPEKKR